MEELAIEILGVGTRYPSDSKWFICEQWMPNSACEILDTLALYLGPIHGWRITQANVDKINDACPYIEPPVLSCIAEHGFGAGGLIRVECFASDDQTRDSRLVLKFTHFPAGSEEGYWGSSAEEFVAKTLFAMSDHLEDVLRLAAKSSWKMLRGDWKNPQTVEIPGRGNVRLRRGE